MRRGGRTSLLNVQEEALEVLLRHTFMFQALDYGDPEMRALYSKTFAYRPRTFPGKVEGAKLMPIDSGGSDSAPRLDTIAGIVERLNRIWGDEGGLDREGVGRERSERRRRRRGPR